MKKSIYLNYLLAHLLLMALGGVLMLLAAYTAAADASPLWALTVLPMAAAAFLAGRRLRTEDMPAASDDYWNAAIALYVVSLALLAALWKFTEQGAVIFANIWNLPTAPALLGFDAWLGSLPSPGGPGYFALLRSTERYHDLILPVMGAVLAAVEPLCLTLGFLSGGRKTNNEEKKTNA